VIGEAGTGRWEAGLAGVWGLGDVDPLRRVFLCRFRRVLKDIFLGCLGAFVFAIDFCMLVTVVALKFWM